MIALFTLAEQAGLSFGNNKTYEYEVFRIHYTAYDTRQKYDLINPRTHPDVKVLARP